MFRAFQFRRMLLLAVLLLTGYGFLEYRLAVLQLVRHRELAEKAARFTRTVRFSEPWRGEIRDRSGISLALPLEEFTLYADPVVCSNRLEQVARTLAPLLNQSEKDLIYQLRFKAATHLPDSKAGLMKALVLKRHVSFWEWDNLTNILASASFGMNLQKLSKAEKALLAKLRDKAVFAKCEQSRIYPYGNTLAHVLGYVSLTTNRASLKGVYGLEAYCDKWLAGVPGVCVSEQNAAGAELPTARRLYKEPANGNNIVLTIDLRLQRLAEQALAEAIQKHHPRSASAIILRPRTGEILAWAVLPNFSPQAPANSPEETWRNHALSDRVEPGSTFKVITLAAALNEGLLRLEDTIHCENGYWRTKEFSVRDHAPYGLLDIKQCLAKSSNIGFAKIALRIGPQRLNAYIRNFGFGQPTGIPLPYEIAGATGSWTNWNAQKVTRIGFGQGLSVSQLQMVMAVGAIANDGVLMRPLLVKRIESAAGKVLQEVKPQAVRTVVSRQTAQQLKLALKEVVAPKGTGAQAALEDYTVAGKTGTAQKADGKRYLEGRYYSSFVGFFPVEQPELCIAVALDEPQMGYYASAVVVPVFRAIAKQAAQVLEIRPDKAKPAGMMARDNTSQPRNAEEMALARSDWNQPPFRSTLAYVYLP